MNTTAPLMFALQRSEGYGDAVARRLGIALSAHEERDYEDGEHKCWPMHPVEGRNAVVFHSLYGDKHHSAHDKLCRLLFFCGALKDAGASQVTAVTPYLCYGRKDRKVEFQDSTITRHVARLMENCGIDRVVALDVHNPSAFDNAYRIPAWNLTCAQLFAERLAPLLAEQVITVVSPDMGGIKRAEQFRHALAHLLARPVAMAMVEKHRQHTQLSGECLVGNVAGSTVVLFDDMISTGQTLLRAAQACHQAGASRILAAATHDLFTHAGTLFESGLFERILVADSIKPFRLPAPCQARLDIVDTSALVAEHLTPLA
ncbi:ribose-phosphate diphosphokinase [Pseudomonas putida]|uniref:ribose-phosphate diphosphokinase n=1 Tax=Pseudomonas putida TaxID=303 RepID=UPI0018D76A3F|nr:ribose-phosphate diphosphokinase [Pseudomonas putida]MBH3410086.1 ribose-phosphate pyrophosphokinase [Pseudomonas putida]